MTIICAPLTRGRIPSIVKSVDTAVTPGSSIDVLVTDYGVAVNLTVKIFKNNFQIFLELTFTRLMNLLKSTKNRWSRRTA